MASTVGGHTHSSSSSSFDGVKINQSQLVVPRFHIGRGGGADGVTRTHGGHHRRRHAPRNDQPRYMQMTSASSGRSAWLAVTNGWLMWAGVSLAKTRLKSCLLQWFIVFHIPDTRNVFNFLISFGF